MPYFLVVQPFLSRDGASPATLAAFGRNTTDQPWSLRSLDILQLFLKMHLVWPGILVLLARSWQRRFSWNPLASHLTLDFQEFRARSVHALLTRSGFAVASQMRPYPVLAAYGGMWRP